MTAQELFDRIEQPEFAAEANLASGWRAFERFLSSAPDVKMLARIEEPLVSLQSIVERFLWTVRLAPDPRYENPYDAALAAYFLVIHQRDPKIASALRSTLREARNTFWARRMADALPDPQSKAQNTYSTFTLAGAWSDSDVSRTERRVEDEATPSFRTSAQDAVVALSVVMDSCRVVFHAMEAPPNRAANGGVRIAAGGSEADFDVAYVAAGSAVA